VRETEAQLVLLVGAFEEADDEGRLLTPRERERASAAALSSAGEEPGPFLLARAQILAAQLDEQVPGLHRLLSTSRLGAGMTSIVIIAALLVGLATNALGPDGRIDVLFAPFMGLVAWNLMVFVALALGLIWNRRRRTVSEATSGRGPSTVDDAAAEPKAGAALDESGSRTSRAEPMFSLQRSSGWITSAAAWLLERTPGRSRVRDVKHHAVVGAGMSRYLASWQRVALPLVAARLERLLHLGAFCLVLGAVIGMYARGLGVSFQASWESTFLDEPAVQTLLNVFLGPAAALLGWTIPDVAPMHAPSSVDAATWIHLYAVTGVLFVLLPRMMLALLATRRARSLALDLPIPLAGRLLRRLLSPLRGDTSRVDVMPYSYSPSARTVDALLSLLHDHFGTRAEVRMATGLEYGAEPPLPRGDDEPPRCLAILFALAQSPEVEVHGRLLAELRAAMPDGDHVLVLIDASGFALRVGAVAGRMAERRRAWDRVVREVGLPSVHVDLHLAPTDGVLSALGAGLWPSLPVARA
jgi:hypothetical protein